MIPLALIILGAGASLLWMDTGIKLLKLILDKYS
jgi:hypothetical protein